MDLEQAYIPKKQGNTVGVYTMDYIYEVNEAGKLLAVMVREDDGYFQINYFDETAYN